jgi:ferritin
MLTETMIEKLNEHLNLEFYSSNLYLQMSAWCETRGFEGSAKFLREHAAEEMTHMMRVFTYVGEAGALAVLGKIDAPPTEWPSLQAVFQMALEHERAVTAAINDRAAFAFEEKDFSTFNFLQWFIAEQHEEEALFGGINDKFEILGDDASGLFLVDREIGLLHEAEAGGAADGQA